MIMKKWIIDWLVSTWVIRGIFWRLYDERPDENWAIKIKEISILKLNQGDILAIKTSKVLSKEEIEPLRKIIEQILPKGCKAMVLQDGFDLEVIRPERKCG